MAGGSPRYPRRDPVDLATASAPAHYLSRCSRTRTRIRICFDNGPVAPVHRQCPRRCGRPVALLRILQSHNVDVLAVQELTPQMVSRLEAADLAQLLPFSHLDPRPGSPGTGLWARWPLTPLPPVAGLRAAAPRARIDPLGGRPVTLTAVHPLAPMGGHAGIWQRELTLIGQAMAAAEEPQVVAGDFNASRDHRPFRDLLGMAFRDCADFSQSRSWPGFTWPTAGGMLPVMRLDHVLVSRTATVRMTRAVRVAHTDHHGVLADIEFT
jgi:endonuclease/exonuclease/phosphatase family metal-dependent hydrolase